MAWEFSYAIVMQYFLYPVDLYRLDCQSDLAGDLAVKNKIFRLVIESLA